ncbi:uncharacterized protein LY89DRAFT_779721 [Mollisia scopiformis]|uniref:Uncharacterized protein n=1 Tax=Mollisia scopiformis TaxID=149040 RepID=A0A194XHX7_MOLSC|nr:uncharacterized protein LY89DRAFT_779721 [Mollisia scopiformis]KUJ19825.1 hypothetical protein LY89DRAFT_779721 [Mollisia scopiformis]
MHASAPDLSPINEVTDTSLQESIQTSNRLSQVMDFEIQAGTEPLSLPNDMPTTPLDTKPSSNNTLITSSSTESTITPGMSEYEKSVVAKQSKEKAESEAWIKRFIEAQPNKRLLSCNDYEFQSKVADFRVRQALTMTVERDQAARAAAEVASGKKQKNQRGKGFRGWLRAAFA